PSSLTELDLRYNKIQDSGFLHLRGFLESPDCRLQTLRVDDLKSSVVSKKENVTQSKTCSSFTPEVNPERDGRSYRYKFSGPGVFQCSLTGLKFNITHAGEVKYRTLVWDPTLLESMNLQAGGPLFSIESPQSSISQLQLPHCQPERSSDSLSVLHITDDGASLIQPVEVTQTHVIVDVPHLSAFGIVSSIFQMFTTKVNGQALLFLDSMDNLHFIHVILLPSNVPKEEVKEFHSDSKFIKVPSQCVFYKDQTYSCHSDPEGFIIQPSKAEVSANYGPNYDTLFKMRLPSSTEEVTIIIKDEQGQDIWKYTLHKSEMKDHEQQNSSLHTEKLRRKRLAFIEKVSHPTLNTLLLKMCQCGVITSSEEENIRAENHRSERARLLWDTVTNKGASSILIEKLKDEDEFCFEYLMLNINQ
ncbi:NACHT, LRR and PYD domains-containing protein 1, partial [Oryzias melastigma]